MSFELSSHSEPRERFMAVYGFWLKVMAISMAALTVFFFSSERAWAHGRYILPSHTVLSGDKAQSVTLIASISNDFFHPDRPMANNAQGVDPGPMLRGLFNSLDTHAVSPSGELSPMSWQAFARASVADLTLSEEGTYRVSMVQTDSLMTTFVEPEGKFNRIFGPSPMIPDDAQDVAKFAVNARVDSFMTRNQLNQKAWLPQGVGLELTGDTHINDVFANEPVAFQLMLNGKPLTQSIETTWIRGGTRHRNDRQPLKVASRADGKLSFVFPEAGYWALEADIAVAPKEGESIEQRYYSLYLTLEVFPE